jgi:hypothetical protein
VAEHDTFTAVETVPIDSIEPHPQNPRKGNVDAVAESLQEHGQYRPIVVNRRNKVIVAGHHVWLAARDLGWEEVSVAWVDLSPEDHLRVMIADNRTSELGKSDQGAVQALLAELADLDVDLLLGTGYNADDLLTQAPGSAGLIEPEEDRYVQQFAVTIVCDDEEHQEQVFNAVKKLGYQHVKAVSV